MRLIYFHRLSIQLLVHVQENQQYLAWQGSPCLQVEFRLQYVVLHVSLIGLRKTHQYCKSTRCMPASRKRDGSQDASKMEDLYTEGCRRLAAMAAAGQKLNYTEVYNDLKKLPHGKHISYDTLHWRHLGQSHTHRGSHGHQQLLSDAQEQVLIDWINLFAECGDPIGRQEILVMAGKICGRQPSASWIPLFLRRHPDIKLSRPSGLDPKRVQAFNRPTVEKYFKKVRKIIERYQIPWENIYNMDEKGCQRGGGRRCSPKKYFCQCILWMVHQKRSDCLELISIIDCVCADGSCILPGFIFAGNSIFCQRWFTYDKDIV